MFKRILIPNCTTGIPKDVKFIEEWILEFPHFIILFRKNYIYENGDVMKASKSIS